MRVGILQCDSVPAELRSAFGDYPAMFRTLLSTTGRAISYRSYDLHSGVFPSSVDECDAWLITGSSHGVLDDDDWISRAHEFVRALNYARRSVVGICFGHQLIAHALGGNVERASTGWGVGLRTIPILEQEHWMNPTQTEISLVVSHQDQVVRPPANTRALSGTDFCPYEIMQIGDHILTFQGHPEFPIAYSRALIEKRSDRIGVMRSREAIASLNGVPDHAVVAHWIVNFLTIDGFSP